MDKFFYDRSRTKERVRNRLGTILKGGSEFGSSEKMQYFLFRRPELHILDDYLHNRQYNHLEKWVENCNESDDRSTQPKVIFPYPRIATGLLDGLLTSENSRLMFSFEDQKKQQIMKKVVDDVKLWPYFSHLIPSLLCNGSAFLKIFSVSGRKIIIKLYNSKSCWPVFDADGELESVVIRYVFDSGKINEKGEKIYLWSQQSLSKNTDVLYDNPEFSPSLTEPPKFTVVQKIDHNLGFVQGVWLTTTIFDNPSIPDGESFIEDSLDFMDSLNYRLSKEDSTLFYNLRPLLLGYGVDDEDVKDKVAENTDTGFKMYTTNRPPDKATLQFLESAMTGLQLSEQYHIRMMQMIQWILRTVLLDPEKLATHSQSAKAMEALHKPVIQYIKKIRPQIKQGVCDALYLIEKLSNSKNVKVSNKLPEGITDESEKEWGTIFEDTPVDISQRVGYSSTAVTSKIISRRTATKHLAPTFGVTDPEEEIEQIENETKQEFEDQRLFDEMTQPPTQPKPKPTGEKTSVKA